MASRIFANRLGRGLDGIGGAVSHTLFEPVIRLGVTGLSRAGKTVFITGLVANLLERGRMPALRGAASGAIRAAYLQPQPDDTVPRFDFETHLAMMTGPDPRWPSSTRSVSQLRLSFLVAPEGLLGRVSGPRRVHVDIVDYPGEWLLDLALLDQDFDAWSLAALGRVQTLAKSLPEAADYLRIVSETDAGARLDEGSAQGLARAYAGFLKAARAAGYSDCTPGRFLLPGELAGSPVLTFSPVPAMDRAPRASLRHEFARRYAAYKSKVVKPFFRDHFSRIDRQVVLVDALGALHAGPQAVEDMRRSMAAILAAFRPGQNRWLSRLLGGRRTDRILFAATKADHLHHSQHGALQSIIEALVADARARADFAGARTSALAIAALRATVEQERAHDGQTLHMVAGRDARTGAQAAYFAGALPDDPAVLLAPARAGAERWLDADYGAMRFLPAPGGGRPGSGPPHIRLDQAAEFLLGDKLK